MRPVSSSLLLCSLCFALPAAAQDGPGGNPSTLTADPMAPGPLTVVPPPTRGPTYGEGTTDDFSLTYHGYLSAPMVIGIGKKDPSDTDPSHSSTPLHSLPLSLPDNTYNTWSYTNTQPSAWAHVAMAVGSSHVFAMLYMGAWNFNQGQDLPENASYAQGRLSFYPSLGIRVDDLLNTKTRLELIAGGTRGRYGTSGKYDSGPYGTTVNGALAVIGGMASLERPFGDVTLRLEGGFGGSEHSVNDPGLRSPTLVAHGHVMGSYKEVIKAGVHYITSWAADERNKLNLADPPDGRLSITGADVRFNGGVFGELFVGASMVDAKNVKHLDGSVQVVHVAGGQYFMNNFFGNSGGDTGTGTLKNVLVQYDYSFGQLARYPENFWGDGPDLRVTLFGMFTRVGSADPKWDNVSKLKYGADLVYAPLPWLSMGLRADHVIPNMNPDANSPDIVRQPGQSFAVLSPRILIRSSFVSHETIGLQYSRYFYPSEGAAGVPQIPDPNYIPKLPYDKDVVSLKGTMWF